MSRNSDAAANRYDVCVLDVVLRLADPDDTDELTAIYDYAAELKHRMEGWEAYVRQDYDRWPYRTDIGKFKPDNVWYRLYRNTTGIAWAANGEEQHADICE